MRVGPCRWLAFAAVAISTVAAGAVAQPPAPLPVDKATADAAAERAKLQAELLAALRRLSVSPAPAPAPPGPLPKVKLIPPDVGKGPDPVREGMNFFRDNDFEAAARVFQLIDPATLPREDRVFVRYMLACSLRRLGRVGEAEVIYREVANGGEDEFLAGCAVSQLSLLRTEQELRAQREQLRSRAKSP